MILQFTKFEKVLSYYKNILNEIKDHRPIHIKKMLPTQENTPQNSNIKYAILLKIREYRVILQGQREHSLIHRESLDRH